MNIHVDGLDLIPGNGPYLTILGSRNDFLLGDDRGDDAADGGCDRLRLRRIKEIVAGRSFSSFLVRAAAPLFERAIYRPRHGHDVRVAGLLAPLIETATARRGLHITTVLAYVALVAIQLLPAGKSVVIHTPVYEMHTSKAKCRLHH